MINPPFISIIIPLHNEAKSLPIFWKQLHEILGDLSLEWEIIFVDDGSIDNTWDLLNQITASLFNCRRIRFTRNFGKEAAIQAGLEYSRGDAIVVMDGDGQHPPSLLREMIELWKKKKSSIVAAKKEQRLYDNFLQRTLSKLFNCLMFRISGLQLENSTDYRLLDRKVVNALLECPERIRFFRGMTEWCGFDVVTVSFDVPERLAGHSKWQRIDLLKLAIQALIAYSAKPLYYLAFSGLLGIFISIVLAAQAFYSWILNIAVSGWTSLTLVILFFGSVNLLGLGILGLYIAQLFDEIKKRPAFLVKEMN